MKHSLVNSVVGIALVWLQVTAVLPANAQTPPENLEGRWEGTLVAPGPTERRLVLEFSRAEDGLLLATLVYPGGARIPIDSVEAGGGTVQLEILAVTASYRGTFNADRTRIVGTFTQGRELPLEFSRLEVAPDTATADAPPPAPNGPFGFGVQAVMHVPVGPTPVTGQDHTHLAYELHVTNFSGSPLLLKRVDVLAEERVLATFEGTELNAMLRRPGLPQLTDKRSMGPSELAIAYMWLTLDEGVPIPASLRHRVTGRFSMSEGAEVSLEGAEASVVSEPPPVFGPPLAGDRWLASNGPSNAAPHRRAMLAFGGEVHIDQRFAIDWIRLNEAGATFSGDPRINTSYLAYGAEVLAVADGVVTAVRDGIPENVPGSRAVEISPDTFGGNHVILDVGKDRFAFYAHLQPGSLRVEVGDTVSRGEVLGLVGNSGNSSEPHLHFQLSDANSQLSAEGMPYVIDAFDALAPQPGSVWESRRMQIPMNNELIRFPEVEPERAVTPKR